MHSFSDSFQKEPEIPKDLKWDPGTTVSWLQINPSELANQLTLLDFALYCRIQYYELIGETPSPNVDKFKEFHEQVREHYDPYLQQIHTWTIAQIVTERDLSMRTKRLQHLIEMASACAELRNFNGFSAIMSALCDVPVNFLEKTWEVKHF